MGRPRTDVARVRLSSREAELLRAHDRPGPRYTSYPIVPRWTSIQAESTLLSEGIAPLRGPVALYVHVPFCQDQCLYCGCTMVVARQQAAGDRFLDALETQLNALPKPDVQVARLHLGGGTPTWLTPDQLERLFAMVTAWRPLHETFSASIEADPDVTTDAHLERLRSLGFTRLSYGVQSLDPKVCEAVGRPQRPGMVRDRLAAARAHGFSVNVDLMYGLPGQTLDTWSRTLEGVCEMAPDRLAVFGYAHVPWMKPHQEAFDPEELPDQEARLALLLHAHDLLRSAGWTRIGFDHFALPDDPLAVAAQAGTLHRDFMGFTDRDRMPMIGLGPSAISELPDRYVQQEAALGAWLRAARAGTVRVSRAHLMREEDHLRRDAIWAVTCQHALSWTALSRIHGVDAHRVLADADAGLAALADDGLVTLGPDGFTIPEEAALLSRRVAMCFDPDRPTTGSRVV